MTHTVANPFQISADTLAALSPRRAKELVRTMITDDARSAGARLDQIYMSGRPDAADGGVDFEVRGAPREGASGLVKKGRTVYQVKSGRFGGKRDVDGILFKDGRLSR